MKTYYVRCKWCTVLVQVGADDMIKFCAPVVKKFMGQPFQNLIKWLKPDQVIGIGQEED